VKPTPTPKKPILAEQNAQQGLLTANANANATTTTTTAGLVLFFKQLVAYTPCTTCSAYTHRHVRRTMPCCALRPALNA
jgi:hypothetical protein